MPCREECITDRVAPMVELAVALKWLGAQILLRKDREQVPIALRVFARLRYDHARRGEDGSETSHDCAAVNHRII